MSLSSRNILLLSVRGRPLPGGMPLVLLFVKICLSGLLGGLIIVENDEEPPQFAWEAVASDTIGWHELLCRRGAVGSHGLDESEGNKSPLSFLTNV
jgi:hypothetical protein